MRRTRRTSGFSLVEILIATGLFAGAALAVTGLFAAAHRMEGDSLGEERATLIASGILESMDRGAAGGFRIATGTSSGSTAWEALDPLSSTHRTVAYTAEGLPLRSLEPSESEGPCPDRETAEIADIRITHAKAVPELVTVEIDVSAPASAPAISRSVHRFVRQYPVISR
jgi:type II secretory pathway pseudopilin PulG